jgi:SAM-dependent methyltransferase
MSTEQQTLQRFYEEAYSQPPELAERYSRWRALGAVTKADHVTELCKRAGLAPRTLLDVGCGDGALLSELHRRGFGGTLSGLELSTAAAALARSRPGIERVDCFDGRHVPFPDGSFELGVLSHVLEHVDDPPVLLGEVARVCGAVVVEVPLEANLSAGRAAKRAHAEEVGHLQRLDRAGARAIVAGAGLTIACELEDALPLAVQRFFADGSYARALATGKWALRAGLHRLGPALARRLFTVHYAALCVPAPRGRRAVS